MTRWLISTALTCGSGLLLTASNAPLEWWPLVWVWALPLLYVLFFRAPQQSAWKRWRFGFSQGWLCGLTFFLTSLHWISEVHWGGCLALGTYLALYPAVWAGFASTLGRARPVAGSLCLAGIWAGLEWLRGTLFSGFGWNGLGIPLAGYLPLAQCAEWTGTYGLSFFVLLFWLLLFHAREKRILALAALAIPCLLGAVGHGRMSHLNSQPNTPLRVSLIQPNVPQEYKWLWDTIGANAEEDAIIASHVEYARETLRLLTAEAATQSPDLVIWPESAIPGAFHDQENMTLFDEILAGKKFSLITGCDEYNEGTYNTLTLLQGRFQNSVIYRKMHLVPFGEYIPLRKEFPPFEWIAGDLIPGDFDRGTSTEPLRLPALPYSVIPLVCFEDTVGYLPRKFIRPESQIIVNVTNDGWFNESIGPRQHFLNARFRSIELRRPLLRAGNTGWSALVTATGQVAAELPPFQTLTRTHEILIPTAPPHTLYAKVGDLFSWIAATCGLLGWILLLRKNRNN